MASRSQYRRIARERAEHYGINPDIFERQIGQESGFNPHARSPAGAGGIAQIMPGTAKAWKVDPWNPKAALDAAAREMARYVRTYGSYHKALAAYNGGPGIVKGPWPRETRNYVSKILAGQHSRGYDGRPGSGRRSPSPPAVTRNTTLPAMPVAQIDIATKPEPPPATAPPSPDFDGRAYLTLDPNSPQAQLPSSPLPVPEPPISLNQAPPAPTVPGMPPSPTAPRAPKSRGNVKIAPGANRKGVHLKPVVRDFLDGTSARYGGTLGVGTGTNHSKFTTTGNVSDHWDGHGADLPATGRKGDRIATAALIEAGVPAARARQMARKGGAWTLNHRGRRIQVIWKTNVGGNHHNHVHVGVRPQ